MENFLTRHPKNWIPRKKQKSNRTSHLITHRFSNFSKTLVVFSIIFHPFLANIPIRASIQSTNKSICIYTTFQNMLQQNTSGKENKALYVPLEDQPTPMFHLQCLCRKLKHADPNTWKKV